MDVNAYAVGGRGASTPHCTTSQCQEKLTFTNTPDEDLDILYAAIKHNGDDTDLARVNDELAGMDGEDKDDTNDKDYDPEQSDNKDSEDKEDNDNDDNDDDEDDAPRT